MASRKLICSYMKNVKTTYKARKHKATGRQKAAKEFGQKATTIFGYFSVLPKEMCFHIFARVPLVDLGNLALTSRSMRDSILEYIRSKQGLEKILPEVSRTDDKENYIAEVIILDDALKYSDHFGDLGEYFFKSFIFHFLCFSVFFNNFSLTFLLPPSLQVCPAPHLFRYIVRCIGMFFYHSFLSLRAELYCEWIIWDSRSCPFFRCST